MKYLIFTACIAIGLSAGCSNSFFELKGKVQDDITMKAIPNRKVIVNELMLIDNKFVPVYLDEFYTNDSGQFNYSLRKAKNVYMFDFSIVGDSDYAYSNYRLGLNDLNRNGKFLSFNIRRLTDLTIVLERNNRTTFHDTLYVSWKSDGINGKKLYPYKIKNYGIHGNTISSEIEFRWIGGKVESAIETKVYADKKTIIYWDLYRKGEIRKITDTIVCRRDVNNFTHFKY